MTEPVVIVNSLGKCYSIDGSRKNKLSGVLKNLADSLRHSTTSKTPDSLHWALKDVSFTVNRGDRIGIIGRNGAGKSTLLKIMSRVSYPTTGEVRIRGTMTSLLEVGTGFNDNLSGRENVFLNASLYGMTRAKVESKFDDIVAFSEVGRFIDTPVKHYSSGMRMRLAFSVAAHLEPDILMLDEVLAVGDMSFQRKCLERVDDLTSHGQTLFFVSHSMDSIMRYCNRCIWLDDGAVRMDGEVRDVISAYVETVLKVQSSHLANKSSAIVLAEHPPVNRMLSADLIKAEVVNQQGRSITAISVSETVGIRFSYRVHERGLYVPAIALYSPEGALVFWSVPTQAELAPYRLEAGVFESDVWLPQDILNIGIYRVTVALVDPSQSPMHRYFENEQLLSFHTLGSVNAEHSSSGILPRNFPGSLKPKLDWSLNRPIAPLVQEVKTEVSMGSALASPPFISNKHLDVSIDTSGFCNARCELCPWPNMSRSESVLAIADFEKLVERFAGYEFGEFAFNSINEPFADKTILSKIRYFIDSKIKTDVLFFSSNWLIPKQETIDEFILLVLKAIESPHIRSISLNATISGIDVQTYDDLQAGKKLENATIKYRPLDFARASENLIRLILGLQAVVEAKSQIVINIKAYGFLFSSNEYQAHWRKALLEAGISQSFINSKVKILLNHGFTSFARQELSQDVSRVKRCSMNWLSDRLVIGPDGAVGLCCHEGARQYNLGNIVELPLNQLVMDQKFLKQLAIVTGENKAPEGHLCQKCEFYVESVESR
jgi:lipopolysaccharide transport system ATP-binding protein